MLLLCDWSNKFSQIMPNYLDNIQDCHGMKKAAPAEMAGISIKIVQPLFIYGQQMNGLDIFRLVGSMPSHA